MTKQTFLYMIKMLKQADKRCEEFNNTLDSILQMPFKNDGAKTDGFSMMLWPFEAVADIFKTLLVEMGESKGGAGWFIYEGIEQIENGGTEIEDDGITYKIKSFEDYYDYLNQR